MTAMPRDLPDFANPPVSEVALSVQFDPIEQLRSVQLGLVWAEFRNEFPKTEEHATIDPVFERFGPNGGGPQVHFQVFETPPVPRIWFLNAQGTELIQVQQDRFIHNWRKVGEGDAYPRFEHLREKFRSELETFGRILKRDGAGPLIPNQCEVTYVNQIVSGKDWEHHGQLGRILTVFIPQYTDDKLQEPEDARIALRYVLKNGSDPIGRLHIAAQPGFSKATGLPMYTLTLTARLRPMDESLDSLIDSLNRGRDAIVRGFASVTTPEMHKIWGRKDV